MQFDNTYINLGESFFERAEPVTVVEPSLFLWNELLAQQLNVIDSIQGNAEELAVFLSGNQIFSGSIPIALAYAGHQFGHYNPQLGDGRAHLLGELIDVDGQRWDLQLKGSGVTRFSRGGDGRCAIGPAIREFIMSEAMHALGVPTSRCLAVTTTGEYVYREEAHLGAVVSRVASSHIRVGSFQYFAATGDIISLKKLADYTINRHYPSIFSSDGNPYVMLLDKVIENQIRLIVQWMRVGFIHGVMNTDNTAVSGETIDFGPCAMMGDYDPKAVFSSIDRQGRYAFGNQPHIAQWNMARLAESLLQLGENDTSNKDCDSDMLSSMQSLINGFSKRFKQEYVEMMSGKVGLIEPRLKNEAFIDSFTQQLKERRLDYTVCFHLLTKSITCKEAEQQMLADLGEHYFEWKKRVVSQRYTDVEIQAFMRDFNPVVIPRNHHVENVIKECEASGDPKAAILFLNALRHPYHESELTQPFQTPAEDHDMNYKTFCGT
ncbi:YdiU family protein [Parashewanella spongiae]|uniref:Protein nucleotidyltransferase YdiU n=1 Tax=Parashewanella spongiae TaxID=342950 RepID=A0A3A6TGI3_9GAMM|nr:YdiU family protein [Parashewanella spongiae]MCL1079227.1 YdiU family protein [Parashewanella spongiae]RJY07880.1 YdiU family protein [Parashewanella spongiae]